ncbi:MAG: helix-turn-helix transcriptional regulator [Lachnospiraceae bacterium]|nr:helix-turn-helix transcriptional regulator [Lachnospiraceae bacterium]
MDYISGSGQDQQFIEMEKKRVSSEIVGQLLELRKAKKMTQQQIADYTGIKRPNIARVEGQHYTPTLDVLIRIADSMGMRLDIRLVEKE